jgi:hypothetical protein
VTVVVVVVVVPSAVVVVVVVVVTVGIVPACAQLRLLRERWHTLWRCTTGRSLTN